jgi:hypothetical protein
MYHKEESGQKGFAIVELIIFVVVVITIGFIGHWALNQSKAMGLSKTSQNISISPTSGPVETTITINRSSVAPFKGQYQVNIQRPDGNILLNVSTLSTPNGGRLFVNTLSYKFPTTICQIGKTCAQVLESPGKYLIWLSQNKANTNKVTFDLTNNYETYLTASPQSVDTTLSKDFPNYDLMKADSSGYTEGLLYGPGFTITNKIAGGFQIKNLQPTQGVGFYESSGGLQKGQTMKIHTYINPDKPNGTYTGSILLQYMNSQGNWVDGPTIQYSIILVDSNYLNYIDVQPLSANETLSRANAVYGLIYGQGITITGKQSTSFQIKYNEPTQGQGFYTSSGGIGVGQTVKVQSYVNSNKPNGTYSGSAIVQYYNSKGVWTNGPTVTYSLNLTD